MSDGDAGKDSLEVVGARHGKHMQYAAAKVYFLSSMLAVLLLASIFLRRVLDFGWGYASHPKFLDRLSTLPLNSQDQHFPN